MKEKLITANLAEVSYLLQERHSLTDVSLNMGTMGAQEMLFTLEGENIGRDRKLFLGSCRTALNKVPDALEEISNLLWKKEEEAAL